MTSMDSLNNYGNGWRNGNGNRWCNGDGNKVNGQRNGNGKSNGWRNRDVMATEGAMATQRQ